jgi:hypothetical protein
MKKDIFIDNNIASHYFSNPIDAEYKKLIEWLKIYNEDEENDAYLVVSPFLIREYSESNRYPNSRTNIVQIISDLTKEGRLTNFTRKQIEAFQNQYHTKKVLKKLLTKDTKDINHVPTVLMSDRKMALSEDNNFLHDLNEVTGFKAITAKRPEELAYKD